MPSAAKPAIALSPNMSWPTRATRVTVPPARAAPTAWLAPLPPAALANSPPIMISPSFGIRSILIIMSVFELPTTRIEFLVIGRMNDGESAGSGDEAKHMTLPHRGLARRCVAFSQFRSDEDAQAEQVEGEHCRQEFVGSCRCTLEFLPDEHAPKCADHGRALPKPVGQGRVGGGGGDDAEAHADVPDSPAQDANEVQTGVALAEIIAEGHRLARERFDHHDAVPDEIGQEQSNGEEHD